MAQGLRVSVIMPAYNAERWLEEAVESVLRQTEPNFELLAIDDGSTDRTPAILAQAASRDQRVRVSRRPHLGLCAALNLGLSQARAPLIARLDCDDMAHHERLSRQAGFLDRHPDVGVLGSWAREIDEAGLLLGERRPSPDPDAIDAQLLRGNPMIHSAIMARTELLQRAGGYRPAFEAAEDYDLWLRLAEQTRLANLPETLIDYRVHPHAVTGRQPLRMEFSARLARRAAEERRKGRPDPASALDAPPDWRRPLPQDAFYAEECALYRWLDRADQEPPKALIAQSRHFTHNERRLVAMSLLNGVRSADEAVSGPARTMMWHMCLTRPATVLKAAWSLSRIPRKPLRLSRRLP
jgi:GT2 family glycosyltransferase